MFHDLLQWLQDVPGATGGDPSTSWSQQFAGSLHLWALTEGTHVLSLMLFAGTILVVDLRMLGVAFRDVPYSTLNNKVLPLTIGGFALLGDHWPAALLLEPGPLLPFVVVPGENGLPFRGRAEHLLVSLPRAEEPRGMGCATEPAARGQACRRHIPRFVAAGDRVGSGDGALLLRVREHEAGHAWICLRRVRSTDARR